MTRTPARRLLGILSVSLLAAMALGVGPASAAPPKWSMTIDKLPPTVTSGMNAGYRVTVGNAGPSNINGLTLKSLVTTPVTYFSGLTLYQTGPSSCVYVDVQFSCSLGTMNAGQSTTFTIAYKTSGAGTFDVTILLRSSSGDTSSDGPKGSSRGDALEVTAKTGLDSSDFAGGYFPADTTLQTNPSLGRQNRQATALTGFGATPMNRYDVMISDGTTCLPTSGLRDACFGGADNPNNGLVCDAAVADCGALYGEWSFVNVKEGQTQGSPFHVTLTVNGSLVPGGTAPSDIAVVHVYYDANGVSQTEVIDTACNALNPPTNVPCLTATKLGSIYKIDLWMLHNGGLRLF